MDKHLHNLSHGALIEINRVLRATCCKLVELDEKQPVGRGERWWSYDNAFWDLEDRYERVFYGS